MKTESARKHYYYLLVPLLLAAALRLYGIDFQSPWLDEIHTLNDANPAFTPGEVMASVIQWDLHPPLYFFVIHYLLKIFGYSVVVARMFSVVMGVASVFAIFRLGETLYSKKAGLFAALLLSVNFYHIYHSQDARPYAMYCLFTIWSFVYLVKFIKSPTRKNALWYGLFATLMLYGHMFGIFTLIGQAVLILFFIAISEKENRRSFFLHAVWAGVLAIVLFLPSLKIIEVVSQVRKFWIKHPTPDLLWRYFSKFFGYSAAIRLIIGTLGLLFLWRLIKDRKVTMTYDSTVRNRMVLGTIIIFAWIGFTVVPPLVLSYISTPMVVDRYYINVLPAILLVAAIGFCQIKFKAVQLGVVVLSVALSLNTLIFVRKYYTTVTKTQYRELTALMNVEIKPGEPVATSLPWHFRYFFKAHGHNHEIIGTELDDYVALMMADPTKIKPFWYVDAQMRYYRITPEKEAFLKKHFKIVHRFEKHDIWTLHYVPRQAPLTQPDTIPKGI